MSSLEAKIRAAFERHTMPDPDDVELTLFDTDALIKDLAVMQAAEQDRLIKDIESKLQYKKGYPTDRDNPDYHRARGFNVALDQVRTILSSYRKEL